MPVLEPPLFKLSIPDIVKLRLLLVVAAKTPKRFEDVANKPPKPTAPYPEATDGVAGLKSLTLKSENGKDNLPLYP